MRSAYLMAANDKSGGSRGGVGGSDRFGDSDYELEVGQDQYASPAMLALCTLIDEITEYLQNSTPIGRLIYDAWKLERTRLDAELQLSRDNLKNI